MRILIVRLSAIGDIVFASSLIGALRQAWPEARLVWLVQSEYRVLLADHPELDAVIDCPLGTWRRLWRERRFGALRRALGQFRAELRAWRFELALDLQGLLKSGLLTWLSGAPRRIGLGSREGSQWLMTRVVPRGGAPRQAASEYRYLAERLGLPTQAFRMRIEYGAAAAQFAAGMLDSLDDRGAPARVAILCPFTTRPQKHWFEDRWAALAEQLWRELGLLPVLLGGPGDRAAAARIQAAVGSPLRDLTGRTRLDEAVALIDRAALVIAVDTGLGHIALARGTPSLLLFGATRPYLETGRDTARVLYHPHPCSPCRRRPICQGRFDCMRQITPEAVIAAARAVLA